MTATCGGSGSDRGGSEVIERYDVEGLTYGDQPGASLWLREPVFVRDLEIRPYHGFVQTKFTALPGSPD